MGKQPNKRGGFIYICSLALVILGNPGASASASTMAHEPQDQTASDRAAEDAEIARVEAILARPEWVWLRGTEDDLLAENFSGGAVFMVGYFPEEELTSHRLGTFRKKPVTPNVFFVDPGTERVRILETVSFQVPDHPGKRCVALLQVITGRNSVKNDAGYAQIVARFKEHLPDPRLTEDCAKATPTPPPAFPFDGWAEIHGVGPVLHQKAVDCPHADFRAGPSMNLGPTSRIEYTMIAQGPDAPQSPFDRPNLFYDFFMRGFAKALFDGGVDSQIVYHGNYDPRPTDIAVELRVGEDSQAEMFCITATASQGASRRQISWLEPFHGRRLPWRKGSPQLDQFLPSDEMIEFGKRVAAEVLPGRPSLPK